MARKRNSFVSLHFFLYPSPIKAGPVVEAHSPVYKNAKNGSGTKQPRRKAAGSVHDPVPARNGKGDYP